MFLEYRFLIEETLFYRSRRNSNKSKSLHVFVCFQEQEYPVKFQLMNARKQTKTITHENVYKNEQNKYLHDVVASQEMYKMNRIYEVRKSGVFRFNSK